MNVMDLGAAGRLMRLEQALLETLKELGRVRAALQDAEVLATALERRLVLMHGSVDAACPAAPVLIVCDNQ